jgi:hypothetical protein
MTYRSCYRAASSPTGLLTYALIVILAIVVFHLLTVSPPAAAAAYADYADKLLILLAGSPTTAVGFYFGTKAIAEGASAATCQRPETPAAPSGHIEKVTPDNGPHDTSAVIVGRGFGRDTGNVEFGDKTVGQPDSWSETSITAKVPAGLNPGKVDVSVNPARGNKIVGRRTFQCYCGPASLNADLSYGCSEDSSASSVTNFLPIISRVRVCIFHMSCIMSGPAKRNEGLNLRDLGDAPFQDSY